MVPFQTKSTGRFLNPRLSFNQTSWQFWTLRRKFDAAALGVWKLGWAGPKLICHRRDWRKVNVLFGLCGCGWFPIPQEHSNKSLQNSDGRIWPFSGGGCWIWKIQPSNFQISIAKRHLRGLYKWDGEIISTIGHDRSIRFSHVGPSQRRRQFASFRSTKNGKVYNPIHDRFLRICWCYWTILCHQGHQYPANQKSKSKILVDFWLNMFYVKQKLPQTAAPQVIQSEDPLQHLWMIYPSQTCWHPTLSA